MNEQRTKDKRVVIAGSGRGPVEITVKEDPSIFDDIIPRNDPTGTLFISLTAPSVRVRRGLRRVLFAAECELDAIKQQKNYKSCGMTRREWENFRLAVEWIRGMTL